MPKISDTARPLKIGSSMMNPAPTIAANPEQGLAMAFTTVMLAGLFQILFGIFKLGRFVTLMPYTVVSGFMTGIGFILIIIQLPPLLGHAAPAGGVLGSLGNGGRLGSTRRAYGLGIATDVLAVFKASS